MKKILVITICLFTAGKSFSQDYCKDIVFTSKELSGDKTWTTPQKMNTPHVSITKYVSKDGELFQVDFIAITANSLRGQKGVYVKFEDGTIIKDENAELSNSYSSESYFAGATIKLTEENIKIFSTKKMVKYQIGDEEYTFPAKFQERYMAYFKCISEKE